MIAFDPGTLPDSTVALRRDVRAFLTSSLSDISAVQKSETWTGMDAQFSAKLGAAGWIGMTWPKQYGGREASFLERYVVLEELLAAGAPVALHWIADRQSGPLILRYGTEAQRQTLLPAIARGECFFCIGMSEPDTGSDLASVRSHAVKRGNGWILNGRKVWTSGAHLSHYMIALIKTETKADGRHQGLSQFLIDLKTPGITIRPVLNLAGDHHFNEVVFDDVELPGDAVIGAEGGGWQQVMSELAYERSGPERYLSSFRLIVEMIDTLAAENSERADIAIGKLVATLHCLRQMSISVAERLDRGEEPALEAAVVKDQGALFEQLIPEIAQTVLLEEPTLQGGTDSQAVHAYLTQAAPSFSLRGGTREILRGIIARGLGLR